MRAALRETLLMDGLSGVIEFADNFNRADAQLAVPPYSGVFGAQSELAVRSNLLAHVDATSSAVYCELRRINHFVQGEWQFTGDSTTVPMAVRLVDASNYVGVRRTGGTWQLCKFVAGAFTALAAVAHPAAIGDIIRLEAYGDTARVYRNGEQILAASLAGTLMTGTKIGTVSRAVQNPVLDNLVAGYL